MKAASACNTVTDTRKATQEAYAELIEQLGAPPSWMAVYCTSVHDGQTIVDTLAEVAPGVRYAGGTSCMGVMTEQGYFSDNGWAFGIFGVLDPEGQYAVAAVEDINSRNQGAKAAAEIRKLLGEASPTLLWMCSAPGNEESIIYGIESAFDRFSLPPIVGGSSGDNTIAGEWFQMADGKVLSNGVVLSAMVPSRPVRMAFESSYDPTDHFGYATKTNGRVLHAINGRPAAEVYNEWTNGAISNFMQGGNILMTTTLYPLGREVVWSRGSVHYQPSHPAEVLADGALLMFSDISLGEKLVLLNNSKSNMVNGIDRVTSRALYNIDDPEHQVAGAMVVYCAGCMMAVQDKMHILAANFAQGLSARPFMGLFSFGEQGCAIANENSHANLTMSMIVFEQ